MAEYGYDMIGADSSGEMLELAMRKKEKSGHDILYLLQDMRKFELYGTVRAVVSVCDCVNYILEEEGLTEVFRLVNNYLDPGGKESVSGPVDKKVQETPQMTVFSL